MVWDRVHQIECCAPLLVFQAHIISNITQSMVRNTAHSIARTLTTASKLGVVDWNRPRLTSFVSSFFLPCRSNHPCTTTDTAQSSSWIHIVPLAPLIMPAQSR